MRVCERIVLSGSFSPTDPARIIARAYYELLENKAQILGKFTYDYIYIIFSVFNFFCSFDLYLLCLVPYKIDFRFNKRNSEWLRL